MAGAGLYKELRSKLGKVVVGTTGETTWSPQCLPRKHKPLRLNLDSLGRVESLC